MPARNTPSSGGHLGAEMGEQAEAAVITPSMLEEEEQLEAAGMEKERQMLEKARMSWDRDSSEMRYKRLQHLLEKSNIYSKFLLTKMEQQQLEEQKRKEKLEKKKEMLLKAATSQNLTDEKEEKSVVKKKRGREDETYYISEVMSKEEILSVAKKSKVENQMLWENGINGILADEMGLGKTIQCIATIALMVERGVPGPFLVCGPLSTLPNWISEFKRFTPEIPIMLYHGAQQERRKLVQKIHRREGSLQIHPVVITSFEIAMRDRNALQHCFWKYLIVDEGHRIKNMNCRLIRELKRFNADNKLLLTGTPLQNNLAELWSLLNFLLPDVFDDLKSFESWFDITSITEIAEDIVAKEREQNILHMLHQILTPFLLRRLKSDVALEVPPKREVVVYAPLAKKQETFYTAIVNRTIKKLLGNNEEEVVELSPTGRPKRRSRKVVDYRERDGDTPDELEKLISKMQEEVEKERPVIEMTIPTDSEINLKLQNIMMLLRKCCNHPYLIEYPLDPATQQFKVDEDLVKNSGKFLLLDRMLPELKKRGHKVLLFSQMTLMLDILMDYCYLRNYKFSRLDGSMSYTEREENMHKFNTDPEVFIFLVSTRAGGLGINLTAADTVIIYDSDWNPQSDLQAQDRCHRIGQTKPVVVYRLVTANTVDQKIVERAAAKRKLEKLIIHKNQFKGGKSGLIQTKGCLDPKELMELLKSRDYEREVKGSKEKVISDKDLELLLDRSDLIDQMKKSESVEKEKVGVFKVLEDSEDSNSECVF
ncbi:lymphoid-specific helicase isoform X3 [Chelonia mydas]|uniref:lymphoid-specific helicase isoform X3 n=1 Tax=Chelonia mydas TaxID=8469 RepID=UPI0018A1F03A|nr:lymphoid-specific helicase isoform X3 [Chelonia mydas]